MHGLVFETSICGWQDQPGSGVRSRRKDHDTPTVMRRLARRTCRAGEHRENRATTRRGGTPPPLLHRCTVVSCCAMPTRFPLARTTSLPRARLPRPSCPALGLRTSSFVSPRRQPHATNNVQRSFRTWYASLARLSIAAPVRGRESPLRRRVNGSRTSTTSASRKPMSQPQPHTPARSAEGKRSDRVRPECPGGADSEQETVRRTGAGRAEDTTGSDPGQHARLRKWAKDRRGHLARLTSIIRGDAPPNPR